MTNEKPPVSERVAALAEFHSVIAAAITKAIAAGLSPEILREFFSHVIGLLEDEG